VEEGRKVGWVVTSTARVGWAVGVQVGGIWSGVSVSVGREMVGTSSTGAPYRRPSTRADWGSSHHHAKSDDHEQDNKQNNPGEDIPDGIFHSLLS
jgi:hypothetical protein